MANTIRRIYELGQSIWCDNISRAMIDSGALARMIADGVVGITSNPTIFMKAITGGRDYDARFAKLTEGGSAQEALPNGRGSAQTPDPPVPRSLGPSVPSAEALPDNRSSAATLDHMAVYEGLVIPDIRDGADALRPVFDRTGGRDGFISLEVNPGLAYHTEETIAEARRLWEAVNRPNLMIKVPAAPQGIPAIATLIGEGINVNVTLIFAIATYRRVMQAYVDGLKTLAGRGGDVSKVASVASFFVSRMDSAVDKLIDAAIAGGAGGGKGGGDRRGGGPNATDLKGESAIANARLAYAASKAFFRQNKDFVALAARGARVQRPLWASTSTKNPAYPDTLYVDSLIGPDTVNTMPPETLAATLDHGTAKVTVEDDLDGARRVFERLRAAGIDPDAVTDRLLTEGVELFAHSFQQLLADIARKRQAIADCGLRIAD